MIFFTLCSNPVCKNGVFKPNLIEGEPSEEITTSFSSNRYQDSIRLAQISGFVSLRYSDKCINKDVN